MSSPKTRPCPRRQSATCSFPSSPSSTRSPTPSATWWAGRPSAWARASSPAYTAPVWPATRPTSGSSGIIPRSSPCSSAPPSPAPSATTPSTSTSPMRKAATCWRRGLAELLHRAPEPLTAEEKKAYLAGVTGVSLGSDAFFPFGDNIERAHRSGVSYVAQPGGSIRDDHVIDTCNKYGMAMGLHRRAPVPPLRFGEGRNRYTYRWSLAAAGANTRSSAC